MRISSAEDPARAQLERGRRDCCGDRTDPRLVQVLSAASALHVEPPARISELIRAPHRAASESSPSVWGHRVLYLAERASEAQGTCPMILRRRLLHISPSDTLYADNFDVPAKAFCEGELEEAL